MRYGGANKKRLHMCSLLYVRNGRFFVGASETLRGVSVVRRRDAGADERPATSSMHMQLRRLQTAT